MKNTFLVLSTFCLFASSCCSDNSEKPINDTNPKLEIKIPSNFPELNSFINQAYPTKYGVELGKKLFNDPRLSQGNEISCATCHIPSFAYADNKPRAVGVEGRIGLRNTPPIQNMAFIYKYMWDGAVNNLKEQPITPIITHEEMSSTIFEVIDKIKDDKDYKTAFKKAFGDETIDRERILNSLAQFMYTLISSDSKYDKVMRNEGVAFTETEKKGYETFQNKCASCHSGALQTDETFRNIGFPLHPDTVEEAGRARVTGKDEDFMAFRVPTLRNLEYTAPYGSFGQFKTLREVLDYFDNGVLNEKNLDPEMRKYTATTGKVGIPLSEEEKTNLIAFLKTLSDTKFTLRE